MPRFFFQKLILILALAIYCNHDGVYANDQFQLIRDLKSDWLVYDGNLDTYVPWIERATQTPVNISFALKKSEANNNQLRLCLHEGTSLFIEQQIVQFFDASKCLTLDGDSLFSVYDQENIFITIYSPALDKSRSETLLVSPSNYNRPVQGDQNNDYNPIRRPPTVFKNFFIIAMLVVLACMGASYQLDQYTFKNFYSFRKAVNFKLRDENVANPRFLAKSNLLILLTHSLIIAFSLIVISKMTSAVLPPVFISDFSNLFSALYDWLTMGLFVFLLIWFKYIIILAISNLFDLKRINNFHFLEFIRLSMIIYLGVIALIAVLLLSSYQPNSEGFIFLKGLIVVLSVIRVIVLYFKFLRLVSFRNLYLFSYLCTTEILPLIVGLKVLYISP
ncbi:DUF4271 domain-containing protein [Fulvivirgaceae bacterium BMA10]|uniref:DUF4271 domain-containing protein n=1 Tax=Splendidivirga corallicola TaxID=3051826 RepID=A0ABT8KWN1_9BACT|nr:DUF4271 domain-containing protein [Fulvivirgaceae bacterium BMA10]